MKTEQSIPRREEDTKVVVRRDGVENAESVDLWNFDNAVKV